MERPIPAGIMPDFRDQLPPLLKENYGRWVWHEPMAPGVYRHLAAGGAECITVRVQLPPAGFLSTATLRRFASWIRTYAQTGRRTSRQSFELVGVDRERLPALIAEIKRAGFIVGGTGKSLHQIKGCNGYVHCQNAALDSPSIMKRLGDALYEEITTCQLPAPLKLAVSGCPNHCGAAVEADIGIAGIYVDLPQVDEQRLAQSNTDLVLLCRLCPAQAIRITEVPEGRSIAIDGEKCIRCAACAMMASEGIEMGPVRGAAVLIGGRGPGTGRQPSLARIAVPYLPAEPPDFRHVVAKVRTIVDAWAAGARPGERIAAYVDRVGWNPFLKQIGIGL